jgi:hypothetical protein
MRGLKLSGWKRKDQEELGMTFLRSARCSLLALVVIAAVAQQQASAQIAPGTTQTGTFVWDGEKWMPVEAPPPPAPEEAVITVDQAPPPLPVYEQPPCPEPNLIWTPGYWHHGLFGFYWVPGAWVPAPYSGALWTPGYWGWSGGSFIFHGGYWGPHIGYYGGVNYGGGYMGIGFAGGAWNGGVFAYNTAIVHVNRTVITNVYVNTTIVQQTTIVNTTNVSYNGGPNGVQHQPAPEEQIAAHETHTPPTTFQHQHVTAAAADKTNLASNNGGHPTNLVATKPLAGETHAPPAGFKPPPTKPLAELAKTNAPPETVAAAHAATTKTASVAKPVPVTPVKTLTPPPGKTPPPAKIETLPPPRAVSPPPGKPETLAPAKTTTLPPAKTLPPPPGKPETLPPAKITPKPESKPATPPPPKKPAPKPGTKPEDKEKPQ